MSMLPPGRVAIDITPGTDDGTPQLLIAVTDPAQASHPGYLRTTHAPMDETTARAALVNLDIDAARIEEMITTANA